MFRDVTNHFHFMNLCSHTCSFHEHLRERGKNLTIHTLSLSLPRSTAARSLAPFRKHFRGKKVMILTFGGRSVFQIFFLISVRFFRHFGFMCSDCYMFYKYIMVLSAQSNSRCSSTGEIGIQTCRIIAYGTVLWQRRGGKFGSCMIQVPGTLPRAGGVVVTGEH